MKKLAVDIDDTLNNWLEICVTLANEYTGQKQRYVDMAEYGIRNLFGWSIEEKELFWEKWEITSYAKASLQPGAVEVLTALRELGWQIVILTARQGRPAVRAVTEKWLNNNNVPYDELVFDRNKDVYCDKHGITVLIEDAPHNILPCLDMGVKVFMPDRPYNKRIIRDKVHRFSNWSEITDMFTD